MPKHYAQNRHQILSEAEIIKTGGKMKGKVERNKKCYITMLVVE
jgi:hypothetical protein